MNWNEFRTSVKGRGYSQAEIKKMYKNQSPTNKEIVNKSAKTNSKKSKSSKAKTNPKLPSNISNYVDTEIMRDSDYDKYISGELGESTYGRSKIDLYNLITKNMFKVMLKEGAIDKSGNILNMSLYKRIVKAYKRDIELGFDVVTGSGYRWDL